MHSPCNNGGACCNIASCARCIHPATMVVLAAPSHVAPNAFTQKQRWFLLHHRTLCQMHSPSNNGGACCNIASCARWIHPATMVVLAVTSHIAPDAFTQQQWWCLLHHRTLRQMHSPSNNGGACCNITHCSRCIHPATMVDTHLDSFSRLLQTRAVNKFNTQYNLTDRKEHWPSPKTLSYTTKGCSCQTTVGVLNPS